MGGNALHTSIAFHLQERLAFSSSLFFLFLFLLFFFSFLAVNFVTISSFRRHRPLPALEELCTPGFYAHITHTNVCGILLESINHVVPFPSKEIQNFSPKNKIKTKKGRQPKQTGSNMKQKKTGTPVLPTSSYLFCMPRLMNKFASFLSLHATPKHGIFKITKNQKTATPSNEKTTKLFPIKLVI